MVSNVSHQSGLACSKAEYHNRHTAHIMAARRQKDRMKLTTFRLLPFASPSAPVLLTGAITSRTGLITFFSLLCNSPYKHAWKRALPVLASLCRHPDRLNDRCLCPTSRVYYMVDVLSFHAPLILAYPEPVERWFFTIPLIRKVPQDCFWSVKSQNE